MSPLILVVDDEEDIRASVKTILEDERFRVITANDGRDCLAKLKTITPDLIILDVLMPGMTTREILEALHKLEANRRKENTPQKKFPIIFLTVVRLAEATKQKIIQGNMVDYIEKPFDNADFIRRVKRALRKK